MLALVAGLVFFASFLGPCGLLVIAAGDCPLDLSQSNLTLAASVCSDGSDRGNCCRYINALVALSISHYANSTGMLGVPTAFSGSCLNFVSTTLELNGIPTSAAAFCGLGPKIRVSYQCEGRETVLQMLQSPNFDNVSENCKIPLAEDSSCRKCLNSGSVYLRHLLGSEDNVTLSVCRDAAFVALANQGDNTSTAELAGCFFGVQGLDTSSDLSIPTVATSPVSPYLVPASAPIQQFPSRSPLRHQQKFRLKLIPSIGILFIVGAILLLAILIILIHKKSKELRNTDEEYGNAWNVLPPGQRKRGQEGVSPVFRRFSYKETKKATNNFTTIIGKGGFGTVFRAEFEGGTIAAVKRMNKASEQGEDEFCREMKLLGRLHHRHLVALKGFCVEKHEKFLVYEYMEKGSLKDHLNSSRKNSLKWQTRLHIAIDVANALEYLHFYCDPPLCHRDIKSSNILLDENFVAKVADFGLAHASRTGALSFEPVNTEIRGTPGYIDPEYVVTLELTEKSDVYSYGVVLLELVTGRRAVQDNKNLVEWAHKYMDSTNSRLHELMDPSITETVDFDQLETMFEVIQWCTQKEGRSRPSIKQVLRIFSERFYQINYEDCFFSDHTVEGGGGYMRSGQTSKAGACARDEFMISGCGNDGRCLQSSSSTSRSYCSRSVLLDTGSPHSPNLFSV